MSNDNLREAFEAEYARLYPVSCGAFSDKFRRDVEDESQYAETTVQVAWRLYCAAKKGQS